MSLIKLILILSLVTVAFCELEKRFVFEMFRHGARSSWGSIGNDGKDVLGETWPDGDGELTNVGKRQHYLLGSVTKEELVDTGYLSKDYNPHEIYIVSTDYNRTIMSAQSYLQGLYQADTNIKLSDQQAATAIPPYTNGNENYADKSKALNGLVLPNGIQVLPIHVFDKMGHEFYLHDADVCPKSFQYRKLNEEDPVIQEFNKKIIADYRDKLKNIPALKDYDIAASYDSLYLIMDAYISAYRDERALIDFANQGIRDTFFNEVAIPFMFNDMFKFGFGDYGDKELFIPKMSMTPTHKRILNWMDTRISRDNNSTIKQYETFVAPKLVIYSGHDTNLAAMQVFLKAAIGITDYIYVPFASKLRYTFSRNKSDDPNYIYTTDDYFIDIDVNGKQLIPRISYTDFKRKVQAVLVDAEEIASFCGFGTPFSYFGFMIATIILSILSVGLIIYLIILSRKQIKLEKANNDPEYQKI